MSATTHTKQIHVDLTLSIPAQVWELYVQNCSDQDNETEKTALEDLQGVAAFAAFLEIRLQMGTRLCEKHQDYEYWETTPFKHEHHSGNEPGCEIDIRCPDPFPSLSEPGRDKYINGKSLPAHGNIPHD